MSKSSAWRVWVYVSCAVALIAVIAGVLLAAAPTPRAASSASPYSLSSQPQSPQLDLSRVQATMAALPLAFEQNEGQTDPQVKYMARGNGYTLFLTNTDAVFSFHSKTPSSDVARRHLAKAATVQPSTRETRTSDAIRMSLVGGNSAAQIAAADQLPGKSNYYIGNDPKKWRTGVAHYARVAYNSIYPGIDLVYYGDNRNLEFDFIVAPESNPASIDLSLSGARRVSADASGNLVISSSTGDVVLHKPVAYQQRNGTRRLVDAHFALKPNGNVGFDLGDYDHSRALVIDPSVTYIYGSYLGGTAEDDGNAIAVDSGGHPYITGQTASANFPGTSPATKSLGFDAFVTKMSADGSSLNFSTYVGGSGDDSGNAISINSTGAVFVAGGTGSSNFPTAGTPFQSSFGGGNVDAFVLQVSTLDGSLTYSTYLGGTGDDVAEGIASDASGNAYVVGITGSTNFPTQNPIQPSIAGVSNGFVTELNSSGAALVYSTYLGGGSGDFAEAVGLDASNNAYVTGGTINPTFPTTAGAFQTTCGSDGTCNGALYDAFVSVIKAGGSGFVYSTFLGGENNDEGFGIAVSPSGNAFVTGLTSSTAHFPLKSALQPTNGGSTDAFVTEFNSSGSALVYSTYLGGSGNDTATGIALDSGGNAYVTGQTGSTNFPTASPTQSTLGGQNDAFVSEINSTGSQLAFSTYLGGSLNENTSASGGGGAIGAIAVDNIGESIYVTGNTVSTDFPTQSPFQSANGGGTDAFVAKYAQANFTIAATTPTGVNAGTSASSTITLTSYDGYSLPVTLSCSVSGSGSPLPACSASSFSTNPVTPVPNSGTNITLTITTTGPSSAAVYPRKNFCAIWLPVFGVGLFGMAFTVASPRRHQFLGFLALGMTTFILILIPACGGSSSSSGGGGGTCAAAPSAPTGLAASSTTSTGTTLTWSAAAVGTNCSVTGYTVYQGGTAIGTPSGATFNVTNLSPSTTYSFTVSASDSVGASPQSTALSVTTPASSGTPSGTYTITITGTDANNFTHTTTVPLTVN